MWFAAYRSVAENPWFGGLILELLKGSPPVLALFAPDPFPDHPPKYVRALLYDYHFTDSAKFARTGQWWERRLEGLYFPPVSLPDLQRVGGKGACGSQRVAAAPDGHSRDWIGTGSRGKFAMFRNGSMGKLDRLRIWDDPAIGDGLAWYRDVAENRRPAKFRIAATVPIGCNLATASEEALWARGADARFPHVLGGYPGGRSLARTGRWPSTFRALP
jgi:hypothetical protein